MSKQRMVIDKDIAESDVEWDIQWTDRQLREMKISKRKLKALLNRLHRINLDLREMDLSIYATGGLVNLHHNSRATHTGLGDTDYGAVIATVDMPIDGGDW